MRIICQNLAFYLGLIWKKDKCYFISFLFLVLSMTARPLISIFLPKLFMQRILDGDFYRFIGNFLLMGSILLLSSFLTSYYGVKNSDLFVGLGFKLKEELQQRAMCMPLADTENPHILSKLQIALSSVDQFVAALHQTASAFLANGLILLVFSFLTAQLQPLFLFLLVVNIFINLIMENRAKTTEYNLREEKATSRRKQDYVFSLMYNYGFGKEIRLFSLQNWIISLYRYYQHEFERLMWNISRSKLLVALADVLCTFLRESMTYLLLILAFMRGQITLDCFILYIGIFSSFAAVGEGFVSAAAEFVQAVRHISDYRGFLQEVLPEKTKPAKKIEKEETSSSADIEFDHVSFHYPGNNRYILKDFCCQIKAGKHIAVVGLNGSGKSTFIKLLCGLYEDYEGTIRVDGIDIRTTGFTAYRERIAAVFQESKILPASILENITLKENCSVRECERAEAILQLIKLNNKVQALPHQLHTSMTRVLEDDGIELSGGEQQKLALCRALYKNADILVLDEPTAALDALAEHELYEQFHTLSEGKTTLFISHRLGSTRFCDEIFFIDDGHIVERGSHEILMQMAGRYAQLFEKQAKYYRQKDESDEK